MLFVNLLYIGLSIVGGVLTVFTGMIGAYLMIALFIKKIAERKPQT
ncbi:hypothetical protein [Succinivibrio dextrinosolvens]